VSSLEQQRLSKRPEEDSCTIDPALWTRLPVRAARRSIAAAG